MIGFKSYIGLTPSKSAAKFPERMDKISKTFFATFEELEKAKQQHLDIALVGPILKDLHQQIDLTKNAKNINIV